MTMVNVNENAALAFNDKHIIEGVWKGRSPNSSGRLDRPTLLVCHYTASGGDTGSGDTGFFMKSTAKASAHFIVGRAGDISQVVECNRRAWHAGVSSWKGKKNCNDFSIGIEFDNWGWLTKRANGTYVTHADVVLPAFQVVEAQHKNPNCHYKYWEAYNPVQMEAGVELIKAILKQYPSITEIVGHEDIAPSRKTDPGPAFPWQHVLAEVLGGEGVKNPRGNTRTVHASKLNVRGGAGTGFNVIGSLKEGETVVILRVDGDWSEVSYCGTWGSKTGWVYNRYIR